MRKIGTGLLCFVIVWLMVAVGAGLGWSLHLVMELLRFGGYI